MNNIKIKSYGAYVPSKVITNDDLTKLVDTSDEWIKQRTGIERRHISEGEDASDLAIKASKMALQRSNLKGEDIDLIIVATLTPDMLTPSVSCLVQKEIKAKNAMAFDVNAACSGFVYSMQVAYSMMNSGSFKRALVVGVEVLSKIVDWSDRSTCVLFGDGSGAVVLEKTEEEKLARFKCFSKGEKGDVLKCGGFDVENPFVKDNVKKLKKIRMEGSNVFKFAVVSMVRTIKELLAKENLNIDDIDYIVPHQANKRIVDSAIEKLQADKDKFYINLNNYGNTSSASIPIALSEMYEKGLLKEGKKVILIAFGGGLTVGSCLLEL